ncbi:MAG: hypothetical protein ACO1RX_02965 [Candidatus Sericytochromatia bacterium]
MGMDYEYSLYGHIDDLQQAIDSLARIYDQPINPPVLLQMGAKTFSVPFQIDQFEPSLKSTHKLGEIIDYTYFKSVCGVEHRHQEGVDTFLYLQDESNNVFFEGGLIFPYDEQAGQRLAIYPRVSDPEKRHPIDHDSLSEEEMSSLKLLMETTILIRATHKYYQILLGNTLYRSTCFVESEAVRKTLSQVAQEAGSLLSLIYIDYFIFALPDRLEYIRDKELNATYGRYHNDLDKLVPLLLKAKEELFPEASSASGL